MVTSGVYGTSRRQSLKGGGSTPHTPRRPVSPALQPRHDRRDARVGRRRFAASHESLQLLWLNLVVRISPAIALASSFRARRTLRGRPAIRRAAAHVGGHGRASRSAAVVATALLWVFTAGRPRGRPEERHARHGRAGPRPPRSDAGRSVRAEAFLAMAQSLTVPFWLALAGALGLQALAIACRARSPRDPADSTPVARGLVGVPRSLGADGCRSRRSREDPHARSEGAVSRVSLSERMDGHVSERWRQRPPTSIAPVYPQQRSRAANEVSAPIRTTFSAAFRPDNDTRKPLCAEWHSAFQSSLVASETETRVGWRPEQFKERRE